MTSHYLGIRHYLGVFGVCKSMAVLNKNILATSGYKIPPAESATDLSKFSSILSKEIQKLTCKIEKYLPTRTSSMLLLLGSCGFIAYLLLR